MDIEAVFLNHEPTIRLALFLGVFSALALWEALAPRRLITYSRPSRWVNNIGIVAVDTVVVRLLFPILAVGVAVWVRDAGWGLLNQLAIADWVLFALALLLLDLALYGQHWLFHAVPFLWRLHRVHHADIDVDVTTGVRFHPVEIVLSMLIKFGVIVVLGASPLAVLVFEVILNATSMFNHSNVRLSRPVDAALRWLVVTPDMHRVHHSIEEDESNRNFGFNLPWWDRIFGTYRADPRGGHDGMVTGIRDFREPRHCVSLVGLLALPFLRTPGMSPGNRPS